MSIARHRLDADQRWDVLTVSFTFTGATRPWLTTEGDGIAYYQSRDTVLAEVRLVLRLFTLAF